MVEEVLDPSEWLMEPIRYVLIHAVVTTKTYEDDSTGFVFDTSKTDPKPKMDLLLFQVLYSS